MSQDPHRGRFGLNTLDQIFELATENEKKIIAKRLHMKASNEGKYYFRMKKNGAKNKSVIDKKRQINRKLADSNAFFHVIKN